MSERLSLDTVYRPLLRGLEGVSLDECDVLLPVRCGLGAQTRKRCSAPIGNVVATPRGLAWVPDQPTPTSADLPTPGTVPMLLPASDPEAREYYCETLFSSCRKGHPWSLGATEVRRRAGQRGKKPYFVIRAIQPPYEWGPRVNDPLFWTDAEAKETVAALDLLAAGDWPPDGITGVRRSQVEGRMAAALRRLPQPPTQPSTG